MRCPCQRTLPVVEIMAALLKRPVAASSTPVRLPLTLPSHMATMLPTLRTERATSSAGVGAFCSITAASAATATGMADLQQPHKGVLQAISQCQALSLWLRFTATAASAVTATGTANLRLPPGMGPHAGWTRLQGQDLRVLTGRARSSCPGLPLFGTRQQRGGCLSGSPCPTPALTQDRLRRLGPFWSATCN